MIRESPELSESGTVLQDACSVGLNPHARGFVSTQRNANNELTDAGILTPFRDEKAVPSGTKVEVKLSPAYGRGNSYKCSRNLT